MSSDSLINHSFSKVLLSTYYVELKLCEQKNLEPSAVV